MAQTYRFHYLEPKSRTFQAKDTADAQRQARMMVADVNSHAKATGDDPCVLTRLVAVDTDIIAPPTEKSSESAPEEVSSEPTVA